MTRFGTWLADRLSRETTSGDFIPQIDGLRCVAIAAVIFHHIAATYVEQTGRFGPADLPADWWRIGAQSYLVRFAYTTFFGVQLFFAISGFVLALPFARHYLAEGRPPSLSAYYLRRLTRLEPPYLVNLTICFLIICATKTDWEVFVPHFLASAIYAHGFVYGQSSWINGVAWSLEVEVQFYLLAPVFAYVFAIRPAWARQALLAAITLGLGVLAQFVFKPIGDPRLNLSLAPQLGYFAAGFLLADLYVTRLGAMRRRAAWDLLVVLSACAALAILYRYQKLSFALPLLVFLAYAGVFLGRTASAVFSWRPVTILGGMCYSVYLYHFLVINAVMPLTLRFWSPARPPTLDVLLQCLAVLPPILVASTLAFVAFEKPFMRRDLPARLARAFRTRPEAAQ